MGKQEKETKMDNLPKGLSEKEVQRWKNRKIEILNSKQTSRHAKLAESVANK